MAQNITLMGASYSAVPAVTLPKTGGGTASFTDVSDTTAAAADVANGKYFYTAAGVRTAGTNSGGGGGGPVLLKTESLGAVSTTSTSATNMNVSVSVTGFDAYDMLIVETSVDTKTNGRHAASTKVVFLTGSSNMTAKTGVSMASSCWVCKISSSGSASSSTSTTSYGVYPNSAGYSNGTVTLPMYKRYNSTSSGTVNGDYTVRVYGVNLYDLIGG